MVWDLEKQHPQELPQIPEAEPVNPRSMMLLMIPWHILAALRIGESEHDAINISNNATRFSAGLHLPENEKKREKGEASHVNAFRHVLWQAGITTEYGADLARKIGWAHENNPKALNGVADPSSLVLPDVHKADEAADLANNVIGRALGSANPNADLRGLSWKVLDEFRRNGLWVGVQNPDLSYRIEKTKLTTRQFDVAAGKLGQMDELGFDPHERKSWEVRQQSQTARLK
jgi:hypothetical protein